MGPRGGVVIGDVGGSGGRGVSRWAPASGPWRERSRPRRRRPEGRGSTAPAISGLAGGPPFRWPCAHDRRAKARGRGREAPCPGPVLVPEPEPVSVLPLPRCGGASAILTALPRRG